jgi:hypothetical protein
MCESGNQPHSGDWELHYIAKIGLFGLILGFTIYLFFLLFFLLHHCEVALKNNYLICTDKSFYM